MTNEELVETASNFFPKWQIASSKVVRRGDNFALVYLATDLISVAVSVEKDKFGYWISTDWEPLDKIDFQ
ncbi:MAG: hypothetical protein F6K45_23105 [Kamptonema sp. SIO1D9]|nr:hypothetical protein [Kamptonema sp. SIO1D9]